MIPESARLAAALAACRAELARVQHDLDVTDLARRMQADVSAQWADDCHKAEAELADLHARLGAWRAAQDRFEGLSWEIQAIYNSACRDADIRETQRQAFGVLQVNDDGLALEAAVHDLWQASAAPSGEG